MSFLIAVFQINFSYLIIPQKLNTQQLSFDEQARKITRSTAGAVERVKVLMFLPCHHFVPFPFIVLSFILSILLGLNVYNIFMITYLNIKRKILILVVAILVLFSSLIVLYQYNLLRENFKQTIDSSDELIHQVITAYQNELKINLSKKTDSMLNTDRVEEAFSDMNREELLALAKPFYDRMVIQNPYIKIMTFRLPDNSVFLRVHKPAMFGDSLNKKRKIIIDTARLQKRHYGFEVGKLKMTYRVVTPIFYNNTYIGLVEIGVEPEYLFYRMESLFKTKNALLVKDKSLLSLTPEMQKYKVDDFVLVRGDRLFKEHFDEIDLTQSNKKIVIYNQEQYMIDKDLNLYDHKGEVAAKILFTFSIDNYLEKLHGVIIDIIVYMILLLLVLLIVLNYAINYFLRQTEYLNHALESQSMQLKEFNRQLVEKIEKGVTENRKRDQQMIEQSRLAQMGEMLSMIAHQWRQPLAAISATSSSLEVKAKLNTLTDEIVLKRSQNISQYSQHLSETIDDFRDFFKPRKGISESSYDEIIHSVLSIVQISIENKNIKITKDLHLHEQFLTYPGELKQVLLNLIKNSEDAILENAISQPMITISTFKKEDNWILTVEDNAGGIPEAIINNIFDPYFSTKKEKNGTGLGLYMSKTIIEDHCNGILEAKSDKGSTVFSIILSPKINS